MALPAAKRIDARLTLLEAARDVLRDKGYRGLSTREVALAAGVPLSQIHYHFGSRQGLVLALFEHLNSQLLARQRQLFSDPSLSLSEQWDRACDYLDDDLASGYVRVMHELSAAGWADTEIGAVVRGSLLDWNRLLTTVARRFEARIGGFGVFSAEDVAALVANAFIGAESHVLTRVEQRGVPTRSSLRRVGDLIRRLESEHSIGGDDACETSPA
jgi:AcrR family transcriptional regulator